MNKKRFSKMMSILLVMAMLFTMMPTVVWADETPAGNPPAAEEFGDLSGEKQPGDGELDSDDSVVGSDAYESYFDKTAATVQVGEPLELTLSILYEGEDDQMLSSTLGGATITINGAATEYKTDNAGKVTLTFTEPGTYNVSATGENIEFQEPLCVVTVNAEEEPVAVLSDEAPVEELESVLIYTGTDFPYRNYYVESLTLAGAQVDYVDGTNVYLNAKTSPDAELTFTVTAGGKSSGNLGINWNDNSENTKTYTTKLENGSAVVKIYAYKASGAGVSRSGSKTFYLSTAAANKVPTLGNGIPDSVVENIVAGNEFSLKLSEIFHDADGDALTYYVSKDGSTPVEVEENWTTAEKKQGTYTFVFTATDNKGASNAAYTVTLNVENSTETYNMSVYVPESLQPEFSIFDKENNKILLTAAEGTPEDGLTTWTVSYPINAETLLASTEGWGSVELVTSENGSVNLRQVTIDAVDFEEKPIDISSSVTWSDQDIVKVEGNGNNYLLPSGREYTYTAKPNDTEKYINTSQTENLEDGSAPQDVTIKVEYKNPFKFTVPAGVNAQLYKYNRYYSFSSAPLLISIDNLDGTVTHYFQADTKNSQSRYVYRASMDGEITRAGYLGWGAAELNWDDIKPEQKNAEVSDESVLLNINIRNNLVLSTGNSTTLKGYRAWEIIRTSVDNHIITPDFHFDILQGEDVINLEDKDSPSVGKGDWKTVEALKEGIAIVEVSYDPILIYGSTWEGVYGATDPARTGLAVIQVGGHDATIHFGIQGKASQGSVVYENSIPKAWDAEFDTLYFIGDSGTLKLKPTASSTITEVAVSNDKGSSWEPLKGSEGVYTAKIVSGNNILRVTTEAGSSYQVVRGDKVTVSVQELKGASNDNGVIEKGETARVFLEGLHTPIPKMAGNYNPGYYANTDGESKVHMTYTVNGNRVDGAGSQYDFAVNSNYLDVTVPEDYVENTILLTEGYIGVGVIGLTTFAGTDEIPHGNSHRNIPDDGCGTRENMTTFNTRSMLPEISITIGGAVSENHAPTVKESAVKNTSVEVGMNYKINPETLFDDQDKDTLSFTVSVNDGEAEPTDENFTYLTKEEGTVTLTFTASDGEEEVSHTITLTVTKKEEKPDAPSGPKFDLPESQIKGYATVSFEDFAERIEGEKGLKYPNPLGIIVPATSVPYAEGDTIADVTLRLLDALGIGASYSGSTKSGFYLGAITNFEVDNTPYSSMGEFDAGSGSGWMITHNGKFIEQGASQFKVKSGDVIQWQYTCQLGKDIGDPFYDEKDENVENVTTTTGTSGDAGEAGQTITTTPTEVTVSGSTATATITKENVTETIKQATENKSAEIVVQVAEADTKDAETVKVQLDTTTVKDIVNKTEAALTVKTAMGTMTFDRETLTRIAADAKGSTVTVDFAKGEGEQVQVTVTSGSDVLYTGEIGPSLGQKELSAEEVKELIADLTPVARSVKTPNKNTKVTVKLDSADKAVIEELEAAGYTVKYNFYRSTKKSSKYQSMLMKEGKSYTNTKGKKDKMYFYKVRVQVYDAEGKLIARTALKQCKYAKRVWTK